MKKLFTLIAAALMAVSANAETRTLSSETATFDNWNTSIKIDKSEFTSAKAGDVLIITASPITVENWSYGSQVYIKSQHDGWPSVASTISVTAAGTFKVEITDTEATYSYDVYDASGTKTGTESYTSNMLAELQTYGLAIQGMASEVTKVEIQTAAETEATTLSETSTTFDESWSGSLKIDKSNFANAKAGDIIAITANPETAVSWSYGSQVFVKSQHDGWPAIASTISVSAAGTFKVEITDTEATFSYDVYENNVKTGTESYTSNMLYELQTYGLVIQGVDATVTKVELLTVKSDATAISSVKAAAETEDNVYYNLSGQRVAKPSKGLYIQNGKKVIVK